MDSKNEIDLILPFGIIFDNFLKLCFSDITHQKYIKHIVKNFPESSYILDSIDIQLVDDIDIELVDDIYNYWIEIQYSRKKIKELFFGIEWENKDYIYEKIFKCNICNSKSSGLCTIPFSKKCHGGIYGGISWHICQIELCVTCFHFIEIMQLNYLTGPNVIDNF